ncbi:MAG TPA: proton-conducting transporter membrane subunit [Polyangia bacterium]
MTLTLVLAAAGLLGASALGAVLAPRADRAALAIATIGGVVACALGAAASVAALLLGGAATAQAGWRAPVGELRVGLDPLGAFFLLCLFLVAGLAVVYGAGYLRAYRATRRLGPPAAMLNLLVASMALVVLARDAVVFLMAWEVMSVASFFLVTFEDERPDTRRAGFTYLIASHAGVVLLFVLFVVLARHAGGFGFDDFARAGAPPAAAACFVLATVGFGTKAGFWPLHVWLPDAHPAAPSHVSALMSGVMIKMGIYGLVRTLTFLGPPPTWWGLVLLGVGVVAGLAGVLHALAQHDLKRLLAYHSVENIGIITLGLGVGLLGQSAGQPHMAFLGYAGALLHVLNHGLFKGLLFQGAGAVLHGTGTRQIDALGGLGKRMPATALAFLVGSVAIAGLPPLNGFVSEWLVYLGAFRGGTALATVPGGVAVFAMTALALIGGLATACFVKAYGVVFLGSPRTAAAAAAHEAPAIMRGPMLTGAALCVVIGLWPEGALRLVARPATLLAGLDAAPAAALGPLPLITRVAAALVGLIAALALLRAWLLRGRDVRTAPTWGCGYAAPTARMQYTATSFAEPLLTPAVTAFHRTVHGAGPTAYFPAEAAHFEEHLGDLAAERVLVPATGAFVRLLGRLRVIQHGRIQLYLAYVVLTLVALLVWQLGFAGN